jgi:hypothetical protein
MRLSCCERTPSPEAIGSPGEWDYRAYPQKARIRATIRTLAPLFASVTIEGPEAATAGDTRPRIFIARAIDYRGTDVAAEGASLAESVRAAGYVPVDPVVDLLPQHWGRRGTTWYGSGGGRVDSNLEWLRRCDAMVVDMSLQDWTYIGCVCEIVYAFLWRIPTVVIAGRTTLEREWLRYHTTRRVDDVPDAIEELKGLLGGT